MADLWLAGFDRRDLGPDGGLYDEVKHPKLGWHTWEGTSWASAEAAFAKYPPHIGAKPPFPGVKDPGKRQYVALNRHAYAFAGSESDDEFVVQVEVAGFARETHTWSDAVCEWLAVEIVDPIAKAVGVPPVIVTGGFHGEGEGIVLASKKSPIRLTPAELRAFSGHLGHQHMPGDDDPTDGDSSGDAHWDPGRLPIARILARATAPQEDDVPLGTTHLDDQKAEIVDLYWTHLGRPPSDHDRDLWVWELALKGRLFVVNNIANGDEAKKRRAALAKA